MQSHRGKSDLRRRGEGCAWGARAWEAAEEDVGRQPGHTWIFTLRRTGKPGKRSRAAAPPGRGAPLCTIKWRTLTLFSSCEFLSRLSYKCLHKKIHLREYSAHSDRLVSVITIITISAGGGDTDCRCVIKYLVNRAALPERLPRAGSVHERQLPWCSWTQGQHTSVLLQRVGAHMRGGHGNTDGCASLSADGPPGGGACGRQDIQVRKPRSQGVV